MPNQTVDLRAALHCVGEISPSSSCQVHTQLPHAGLLGSTYGRQKEKKSNNKRGGGERYELELAGYVTRML